MVLSHICSHSSFTVCLSLCLTLTLPCLPVTMTPIQVDEYVLLYVCLRGDRLGWGDGYTYGWCVVAEEISCMCVCVYLASCLST